VAHDNAEAVRFYRLAAAQGLDVAMRNLGYMLERGRGVAQDDAEALFDAVQFAKSNKNKLTSKAGDWHNMPTPLTKDTPMPTRNVVLTEHQASLIERLVTSGRYQNASEVLREGLRMVEQREKEDANRLQALREAMELGMADFEAGRYKQFDTKESLRAHLKSIVAKAAAAA
jgi:antitoxin ParD1/3/4